ncbi:flagellar assembly protein FliH [Psychromonas sp. SP041]|uniref:flagellar assembly protein FliH n=1 Tax=Psychromonas sp. SP041 TaxID=1365007 RepID=UPI0010C7AF2C|nr:flagellar assembly protein FliH [Psychromonas sp. SP041]
MAADTDNDFQEWVLPDFENDDALDQGEVDLFGRPASWYQKQEPEDIELKEDAPKPLTLEDIESIRASAYEDGFNEGKEAGFAEGIEEGKLQGLNEGHEQGVAQGLEQGLMEGKVKVEAQTQHWEQLVSRLHAPLEKLDDTVEFQLIKLATNLAEQMARCEVTINPQIILQALKQGVEALPVNEQSLVISLNPEDLIFVQDAFSEEECKKRGWDLRAEPTLLRGDCQIHTQTSSIDYAFSIRVEQVLKSFLKENYQNTPEVSNDGDISNDQPLDYEMKTEEELHTILESEAEQAKSDNDLSAAEHSEAELNKTEVGNITDNTEAVSSGANFSDSAELNQSEDITETNFDAKSETVNS